MALLIGATIVVAPPVYAQSGPIQAAQDSALPDPEIKPLAIDFDADPVLALADVTADPAAFRTIVVTALGDSPTGREALALEEAAEARVWESRSGYLPTIDVGVSGFKTLERNFSDDPFNLIERSRPRERVDFTFSVAQPLIDFGRTDGRVGAAAAQLRAAGFEREARLGQAAGETIVTWTQVFGYQALVRLYETFIGAQQSLNSALDERIESGVSAEGDRARVASLAAEGQVQLAQYRRLLANAEARFEQLTGFAPPDRLLRPPMLDGTVYSRDYVLNRVENAPEVLSAEARAEASEKTADAAEAEKFPQIGARLENGRYGIFENGRNDYDTRATVNLNWRILGGGIWSRARAADAEAVAANAVADRIREEARRDAAIAWSDVRAIEAQIAALEDAYKAARQSRDIVVVRFGALRGTLFDVAEAENAYLAAASSYIRALTELDQARYVLLLRMGLLLDALEVEEDEARP